ELGVAQFKVDDLLNLSTIANGDVLRAMYTTIGDQTNRDFKVLLKDRKGNYNLMSSNLRNIITATTSKAIDRFNSTNYVNNKISNYNLSNLQLTELTPDSVNLALITLGFTV